MYGDIELLVVDLHRVVPAGGRSLERRAEIGRGCGDLVVSHRAGIGEIGLEGGGDLLCGVPKVGEELLEQVHGALPYVTPPPEIAPHSNTASRYTSTSQMPEESVPSCAEMAMRRSAPTPLLEIPPV